MAEYKIGIDGGGTKTRARIWDEQDRPIKDLQEGPSNLCSQEPGEATNNFIRLCQRLRQELTKDTECGEIVVGIAGISNPEVSEKIRTYLQIAGFERASVRIVSDAQIALYGALENPAGILLNAGTGSICMGIDSAGNMHQAGGYGHLLGDEGSGYGIGRDILKAALEQKDGCGEETCLTELLYQEMRLEGSADIIRFAYGKNAKKNIASVAPLLLQAIERKDRIAERIAENAASSLFSLIRAVVEALQMQNEKMAFGGGILCNMSPVTKKLSIKINQWYPQLDIRNAKGDALDGALYLMHMAGKAGDKRNERVIGTHNRNAQ